MVSKNHLDENSHFGSFHIVIILSHIYIKKCHDEKFVSWLFVKENENNTCRYCENTTIHRGRLFLCPRQNVRHILDNFKRKLNSR